MQSTIVFNRAEQIVYNREGNELRVLLRSTEGDPPSDPPRVFDDYGMKLRKASRVWRRTWSR